MVYNPKKLMKNSNVRTLKTLTYMMKYYDFITLEAPPTMIASSTCSSEFAGFNKSNRKRPQTTRVQPKKHGHGQKQKRT